MGAKTEIYKATFLHLLESAVTFVVVTIQCLHMYYLTALDYLFPKPLKSLIGEVILVTGSGNGIGREICLQLANSGAKIVCWDVQKEDNKELVKTLKRKGAFAYSYVFDISDRALVTQYAEKVRREVGNVTVIFNNAGIAPCGEFLNSSPEALEKIFGVNLFSQFWILREFLPHMVEASKGHIVTTCSMMGLTFNRYMAAYSSSKAAIHAYLECLKSEIRNSPKKPNIHFTTVYPTAVSTRLLLSEVSHSARFPLLTPTLEPADVARQIIDGFRREKEYIYLPQSIRLFLFLEGFMTSRIRDAVMNYLMPEFKPSSVSSNRAEDSQG